MKRSEAYRCWVPMIRRSGKSRTQKCQMRGNQQADWSPHLPHLSPPKAAMLQELTAANLAKLDAATVERQVRQFGCEPCGQRTWWKNVPVVGNSRGAAVAAS